MAADENLFFAKYLYDTVKSQNGPLYYFYQMLYNVPRKGLSFEHPDISGYTLTFMQPPHLSGYGYGEDYGGPFGDHCKFMCFAGIDFTPPASNLQSSDVASRSGALPYGSDFSASGQLSMTFIDNQDAVLFSFHKLWVNYIEDIIRGKNSRTGADLSPDSKYYTYGNQCFGELDYATSAYVVRFKPSIDSSYAAINYIGKATGIFPINIPDKEEIGRRDSNELIMLPMSYTCTFYRQFSPHGVPNGNDQYGYLYDEFTKLISTAYGSSTTNSSVEGQFVQSAENSYFTNDTEFG